jgi:hypothetical protein
VPAAGSWSSPRTRCGGATPVTLPPPEADKPVPVPVVSALRLEGDVLYLQLAATILRARVDRPVVEPVLDRPSLRDPILSAENGALVFDGRALRRR